MKNLIKYSVVIPVYRSAKTLPELVKRVTEVMELLKTKYEIILIDDSSPDNSWEVLKKLKKEYQQIKIIQLMRNYGQHRALVCGFKYASGELVITMDDDLQHPPEEIPKLIDFIKTHKEYDAVMAVPSVRNHASYRNIGSYLADKIINFVIKKPSELRLSSFRILRKVVVNAILSYQGQNIVLGPLICLFTNKLANIEVKHDKRKLGKSTYSFSKLLSMTLSVIFNFSLIPLKFLSLVGTISFVVSFLFSIYIIIGKLTGVINQAGFATLAVLISMFSGLILLSFGILGEYLMRILNNTRYKENSLIREIL